MIRENHMINKIKALLGLNTYEAKAYLAILKLGSASPLRISTVSGVPRGRIYDVLKSLELKGLVYRSGEDYHAVRPKEALSQIAYQVILEANTRHTEIMELANSLENTYGSRQHSGDQVRIIHGLVESLSLALTLLKTCKNNVIFSVSKAIEKIVDVGDYIDLLIEALPQDTLIVVSSDKHPPREYVEKLLSKNIRLYSSPIAFLDMMIACDNVLIGLPSSTHTAVTIYVKHKDFAESLTKRILEHIETKEDTRES
ncbi:MAG: hypothetical protein GSR72_03895 [Desulfurococcales archaeon]|nr:hypothetical protein [Desulfurococcales archaeon]MEB3789017.1 hypothetical protein [Desulfurococcales archaeon]